MTELLRNGGDWADALKASGGRIVVEWIYERRRVWNKRWNYRRIEKFRTENVRKVARQTGRTKCVVRCSVCRQGREDGGNDWVG
jgi:hypothetical protein